MKKELLILLGLLVSSTMPAQNGGKHECQLPQGGKENVHIGCCQGKAIDQMNYEGEEVIPGRKITAAFDSNKLGTGANNNLLFICESQFSVEETMARIEQVLKTMDIPVFAKFDHSKNAQEVGLKLLPNQVIVFGSPKVGTALMQQNPSISIELPLKISVWEDKKGCIWVTFPQMRKMAINYGVEDNPVMDKMQKLLEKIVSKAASQY